jgi:hypothetical protein
MEDDELRSEMEVSPLVDFAMPLDSGGEASAHCDPVMSVRVRERGQRGEWFGPAVSVVELRRASLTNR